MIEEFRGLFCQQGVCNDMMERQRYQDEVNVKKELMLPWGVWTIFSCLVSFVTWQNFLMQYSFVHQWLAFVL